jgi:hypothetical protein
MQTFPANFGFVPGLEHGKVGLQSALVQDLIASSLNGVSKMTLGRIVWLSTPESCAAYAITDDQGRLYQYIQPGSHIKTLNVANNRDLLNSAMRSDVLPIPYNYRSVQSDTWAHLIQSAQQPD